MEEKMNYQIEEDLQNKDLSLSTEKIIESQALVATKKFVKKVRRKNGFEKSKQIQVHMIMKNSQTQSHYQQDIPITSFLFRPISQTRVFFVAGDIIVELEDYADRENTTALINEFRNIVQIERNKNGAMSVLLDSVTPIKELGEVLYCLENSQNSSNFEFAADLRLHTQSIASVERALKNVLLEYSNKQDELTRLLSSRKQYVSGLKQQLVSKFIKDDEFACIGTMGLNFKDYSTMMQHMTLTPGIIAFLGFNYDDMQIHLLRKGFLNQFEFQSRRMLFKSNIQRQQQDCINEGKNSSLNVDLQFTTMDGIRIHCKAQLDAFTIVYPPNLQLAGDQYSNQIEQLFTIKMAITPHHIQQIIKLREDKQKLDTEINNNHNSTNEFAEILSLEYAVQSELFCKSYYPNELRRIANESISRSSKNNICKYRQIQ